MTYRALGRTSLANPAFLAVKAGLAAGTALLFDTLLGNPDHVSSTFIAVLCVSPTVLMGLRRAAAQVVGSVTGGLLGGLAASLGLPLWAGIPSAVGLAVYLSFQLGQPMGYAVAAFAALFVQLVPRGDPVATVEVRILAVLIAGASGFLVNVVISSHAYGSIFRRRARLAERTCLASLPRALREGPDAVQPAIEMLGVLKRELDLAIEELGWRRAWRSRENLIAHRRRVFELRHLAYVTAELAHACQEQEVPMGQRDAFASWLAGGGTAPPAMSGEVAPAAGRVVNALERLDLPRPSGSPA